MHVEAQELARVAEPGAVEVGWFAARQPGIIRFLEQRIPIQVASEASGTEPARGRRIADDGDALGLALLGAWRVHAAFQLRDGVPPVRIERSLLDRAAIAVAAETRHGAGDGCATRQPDLCAWLQRWLADPPTLLTAEETARVRGALLSVIYALDQVTTGRPIP